jgi:5'-3' exonuclease
MKTAPLLLVDTPSLYFRAFHGIPESAARAEDGSPVNAVRGTLDMLATLIRTRGADRMICALDYDWRPAWRVALIDSYKKHRLAPDGGEEVPDTLSPQVPLLLEVLAAIGIPTLGATGYEADDVLGTLAVTGPGPVEIASGDRDLFQLVDDGAHGGLGTKLLYCGRGVAKLEVYDEPAVLAKYGVRAGAYADFAALRGDPSDGLPGVAGVGEKTAARLIERYGDLDAIVAAVADPASDFAPGIRTKIIAAADYLKVAPTVVKVALDVELPDLTEASALAGAPRDPDKVLALAQQWNLAGSCRRLIEAITGSTAL